ncbi:hypothetical protein [uncultured Roseibium sp.]|uniref:hypothetical protein n=1 Tax=uncultured Roseibium sp. TaxID=1936171 RepID=UPI003216E68F
MSKTTDMQGAITHLEKLISDLSNHCAAQQTLINLLAHAIKQGGGNASDALIQYLRDAVSRDYGPIFEQILDGLVQEQDSSEPSLSPPRLRLVQDEDE